MQLEKEYVLKNVTLIDGTGGAPQGNMAVRVRDGKIDEILPVDELNAESGIQEVDLEGHYIVPGLIDAHVHIPGFHTNPLDQELEGLLEHKLVKAMRSVAHARQFLKYGFTSLRDISWNGLYLKRVFHEGTMAGPRIVACGPGLVRRGGHGDLFQLPMEFVEENHFWGLFCDGPEEIRKGVRRLIREGSDQIKLWATGGDDHETDRNGDLHFSFEEIKMAVDEAKMIKGTRVLAHCESLESIRLAIEAGVDSIEHGECLDEEAAEQMAEKGIILVPTLTLLLTWYDYFRANLREQSLKRRSNPFFQRTVPLTDEEEQAYTQNVRDNFKLAQSKGVKIALGSDTVFEGVTPAGEFSSRELGMLVECGMSPMEAISAATQTTSEALGLDHKVGTIEKGKLADYLVVKENPEENIEVLMNPNNLKWVVMEGNIVVNEGVIL